MVKTLYLLCGLPASGKSTWAKEYANESRRVVHISRDAVRFSMVDDAEPYFKAEKRVFSQFIKSTQQAIDDKNIDFIFVDATHLNSISRHKVLDRLDLKDINVVAVAFCTPLDICLERNSQRKGRERVPDHIIQDMNDCKDFDFSKDNFPYIMTLELYKMEE